jgi:uncharacterized protein (UPF0332 family)
MSKSKQEKITHCLNQADESLISAEHWFHARKPNFCINHIFFAYLNAMLSMLWADDHNPRHIFETIKLFEKYFTKTYKIPEEVIMPFKNLVNRYELVKGDFDLLFKEKPYEIENWIEQTHIFVEYVKRKLVK